VTELLLVLLGWAFLLLVGVPLSIGLHEIGHLYPAKKFGIKCTQYMIGFGPTIWSRTVGETEYGVKAIPLGGYVRMIGMYPPRRPGRPDPAQEAAPGRWATLIEEARHEARANIGPEDLDRQFYQRPVWQRVVVMMGGPLMNLVIAVVVLGGILTLYGVPDTTRVGSVSQCVPPATAPASTACSPKDPAAPSVAAGLQPGDKIVSVNGHEAQSWLDIRAAIRENGGRTLSVVVRRDGTERTLTLTPVSQQRQVLDAKGNPVTGADGKPSMETVGFAGLSPSVAPVRQPVWAVPGAIWTQLSGTAGIVLDVPAKMVNVVEAMLGLEERDPNGPQSLIGVGRIAGDVTSGQGALAQTDPVERIVFLFGLLASLNVALFVFNLVPLLPLDGGHVAGALWEGLRRQVAKLRRRPDPGPVDTARALPLIYAGASLLIALSGLLIVADLISPVKLSS
jgi:membrane-associated protease RseP (regulator of RpoE activity)